MRYLLFILLFSPFFAWGQSLPATGDDRVRFAVGQTIRETIRTNFPAANDNVIDKTILRVGQVMGDAANNPSYEANANRWAWIGFRLIQRANPYISIALELCAWQGLCTPNKKLQVIEVTENDSIVTEFVYEQPYPNLRTGFVYFAGKSIPQSSFTCGGTDSYIANFEFYWPGPGDPCRVQAAFPSAISSHQIYLEKFGEDYFGIAAQDFDYSPYFLNTTMAQVIGAPAIVCRYYATGNGTSTERANNPYFPCITQAFSISQVQDMQYYTGGYYTAYTWEAQVRTTLGTNIKIVTDFPMSDLQLYPDAPKKGRIDLYPWLQSLTTTDLAPLVSPAWINQVATAAWLQATKTSNYDGLPFPENGISNSELQSALNLLANEWPTIGDIIDPIENNNLEPYYKKNSNPVKVYRFNWSCGFSNFPKCLFDFIVSPSSPTLDDLGFNLTPFDPLLVDSFAPPNNFSTFLNSRLSGGHCSLHPSSAIVSGKTRFINWDFCRFAVVARDVLALLAYITTAGVLIGGLRTSNQLRK